MVEVDELTLTPGVVVEVIPAEVPGLRRRGKEGILVGRHAEPPEDWLRSQQDSRWREYRDACWWKVLPLEGGSLLVPEPVLRPVRRPSYNDVMTAVTYANEHGRRTIAGLYPDLVAGLLKRVRRE